MQSHVEVGVDLRQANVEAIDDSDRRAETMLPAPFLRRPRPNQERTRIYNLSRSGPWQLVPGHDAEQALVNWALKQARPLLLGSVECADLLANARLLTARILEGLLSGLAPKNRITVGAVNPDDDWVMSFTSWSPAADGRTKPNLVAPGGQVSADGGVTSCSSSGDDSVKCSTSMASPNVCDLSALLIQDFRAQFVGEPDFRNATLNILLAHNGEDFANPGPDYDTDYSSGRIQPTVDFMRTGSFLEAQVDQGESYSVFVPVEPGDPQLQVTLAWDERQGTPNDDLRRTSSGSELATLGCSQPTPLDSGRAKTAPRFQGARSGASASRPRMAGCPSVPLQPPPNWPIGW